MPGGVDAPGSQGGAVAGPAPDAAEPTGPESLGAEKGESDEAEQQQQQGVELDQAALQPDETALAGKPDAADAAETAQDGDAVPDEATASGAVAEEKEKPENDIDTGGRDTDTAEAGVAAGQEADDGAEAVGKAKVAKQQKKRKKRKKGRLATAAAAALRRQTRAAAQKGARPSVEPGASDADSAQADARAADGADSGAAADVHGDRGEAAREVDVDLPAGEHVAGDAEEATVEEPVPAAEEGAADPGLAATEGNGPDGADDAAAGAPKHTSLRRSGLASG